MDIFNKAALTDMAGSILRPLITVLMRNKFTHSELTELVRQTYIEVAYTKFSLPEKRMTYSRAALLSGLSRKEVVRLHNNIKAIKVCQSTSMQQIQNRVQKIVNGWHADSAYLNANKKPLELPISDGDYSFSKLVEKYCGDIAYGPVLEELLRLEFISKSSNDTVKLLQDDYSTAYDELENIRVMSVCVSDLFSAGIQNTGTTEGDIRFQRQFVYSGIEETLAQRFHEAGNEKAMALFELLNEFLSSSGAQTEPLIRQSVKRVGLGIYYFEDASPVRSIKMTSEEHA